jgi:hypothetical protein
MFRLLIPAALAGSLLIPSGLSLADELDNPPRARHDLEQSWHYQPSTTYQPNPRAIVHQKSMARAQQRAHRLASMNWYGMSNLRPTASPTPFTTLYSPVWQMPGGRPFAWYTSGRPTYIFR